MRKFTAILMALAMMLLPVAGLAASPADLLAEAAGQPVQSTLTFGKVGLPEVDEDVTALINDLFTAMGFQLTTQDGQGSLTMSLSDTQVLDLAFAQDGDDMYVKSNLLGEKTLAASPDEAKVILEKVLQMMVDSDVISENDLEEIQKALEQSTAQATAQMQDLDLSDIDVQPVLDVVMKLAEKVTTGEVTAQPKNSDPATSKITVTLTGTDIADTLKAFIDVMKSSKQLTEMMDAANLTLNDESVTTAEMYERLPAEIDKIMALIEGDVVVDVYLNDAGEPVYGTYAMTMKVEDDEDAERVTMDFTYARLTTAQGLTHTATFIAKDTEGEGISATVDALQSPEKSFAALAMALLEDGAATPVLTLDATLDKAYGDDKSANTLTIAFNVSEEDGEDIMQLALVVDSAAEKAADGTVKTNTDGKFSMTADGETLEFNTNLTRQTGVAADSIVTADAVRPGAMNDSDFELYLAEVGTSAMNALIGILQNLPESILSLVMAQ